MLHPILVRLISLVANTWVVDAANGPGTHFLDLPAAVSAAQSGDTILVRAGSYSAMAIAGKALTIRGAGSAATFVGGAVITNVPAPGYLMLAGMQLGATALQPVAAAGVNVAGPGRVVMLDCVLCGARGTLPTSALELGAGSSVHATRCTFLGGGLSSFFGSLGSAGAGARVGVGAQLAATACTFHGGDASVPTTVSYAVIAGSGLLVQGEVELSGCDCHGGSVSTAYQSIPSPGSAVIVGATPGRVRVAGPGTLRGGTASWSVVVGQSYGLAIAAGSTPGSAVVHGGVTLVPAIVGAPVTAGAVTFHSVTLPRLVAAATVASSGETSALQPFTMTLHSQLPLAPFAFVVGFAPDIASPFGQLVLGPALVDLNLAGLTTGTLDAQGGFSFTLVPANVLAGVLGIPVFSQAFAFDAASLQFWASNVDERIFSL